MKYGTQNTFLHQKTMTDDVTAYYEDLPCVEAPSSLCHVTFSLSSVRPWSQPTPGRQTGDTHVGRPPRCPALPARNYTRVNYVMYSHLQTLSLPHTGMYNHTHHLASFPSSLIISTYWRIEGEPGMLNHVNDITNTRTKNKTLNISYASRSCYTKVQE